MTGLTIGGKHTYKDFGLKMLSWDVSLPEIREEKIEVPGMDGKLDLSEFFGEVIYNERKLTATFEIEEPSLEVFATRYSEICNYMHGLSKRITPDADPLCYYEGRIKVSYTKQNRLFYVITIEATVAPYKMRLADTVVTKAVAGSAEITLRNERKSVVPSIVADAEFRLEYGGVSVSHAAGEYMIASFMLPAGESTIKCYGTGNITFRYQEGSL